MRIRAASEQPRSRRGCFGPFYRLYGDFDPAEMDSGFGRIRARVDMRSANPDLQRPTMDRKCSAMKHPEAWRKGHFEN